jgi:hypothetical protein
VPAVSTMLEWPRWSCTVRRSTPAAKLERSHAGPKIVQPDRRQPGFPDELPEDAAEPVGGQRAAVEVGEHVPAGLAAGPNAAASASCRSRCARSAATVVWSSAIVGTLCVLGGQTARCPSYCCSCWLIIAILPSRSTSDQRSPAASPSAGRATRSDGRQRTSGDLESSVGMWRSAPVC